jgi:hypothetical protein
MMATHRRLSKRHCWTLPRKKNDWPPPLPQRSKPKIPSRSRSCFRYSKWEVFPGAIVRDKDGPLHVSLHDIQDIQEKAQEFYQDWDKPHTGIHIDFYDGTEWKYLHDIALLEPYKLQKKAVPVRVARFFDHPDILTIPYRNYV